MVQQWVKDLQAVKGLAPSTIETIYIIFASILRGAVRDGYLRKTPCDDIRLPEITPTVIRLLAPAEVLALAAAMPRRYALLVLLGAGAGLRQGEAFGLAVNQIDAAAGMITVSQQVIVVDRHPVLAPPKTSASMRDVPMPLFLQDARQEWPPTRPFMTCGTPLPAPLWPKACRSPRSPVGSATSRSRPPWTCMATWSPEASGRARDALDRAFASAGMCPESAPTA
jgi:hypothetical protein